jgi:hypothetical protein
MLDARFQPLPKWTRKPALGRQNAHFKTPYKKTLDKLEYELGRLDARDIRIEAGYERSQISNDGWPRGGMRPSHPGVVLYFETKDGAMCFPCGTYGRLEDNLHAIALTLENLRAVDRYGVTLGHEQYRGFLALPPAASTSDAWTIDRAAEWLNLQSGRVGTLHSEITYRAAYRDVAARLHPDAGGSPDQWQVLQKVKQLLDQHFKPAASHA